MTNEKKQLRVFGYGLALIIGFFVVRSEANNGWPPLQGFFITAAAILALITALRLEILRPLFTYWMKAAHWLGFLTTTLILTIVFYSIFGLAGIILRLARKDLLDRRLDPQAETYWKIHQGRSDYLKQF